MRVKAKSCELKRISAKWSRAREKLGTEGLVPYRFRDKKNRGSDWFGWARLVSIYLELARCHEGGGRGLSGNRWKYVELRETAGANGDEQRR
jgi:hypothetical protein